VAAVLSCYFEDDPLRLVVPNLWPSVEEVISFLKIHRSTLLDVYWLGVGPAAIMVDLL
jgi:hypothetical protein